MKHLTILALSALFWVFLSTGTSMAKKKGTQLQIKGIFHETVRLNRNSKEVFSKTVLKNGLCYVVLIKGVSRSYYGKNDAEYVIDDDGNFQLKNSSVTFNDATMLKMVQENRADHEYGYLIRGIGKKVGIIFQSTYYNKRKKEFWYVRGNTYGKVTADVWLVEKKRCAPPAKKIIPRMPRQPIQPRIVPKSGFFSGFSQSVKEAGAAFGVVLLLLLILYAGYFLIFKKKKDEE